MADQRNQLIALVKARGPVLPSSLTKELNTSTMFISAMLSELVDKKLIRISYGKVGGGPVYFVDGQEAKLPALIYPYLHEKEKKIFDYLKKEGVLRHRDLEPVFRAILEKTKGIKDFAIPLEVSKKDGSDAELFSKFFLTSDADAAKKIHEILAVSQLEKKTKSSQKKRKKKPNQRKQKQKKAKKASRKKFRTSSAKKSQKKSQSRKKPGTKQKTKTSSTKKKQKKPGKKKGGKRK